MRPSWIRKLLPSKPRVSWMKSLLTGSLYKISDIRGDTSLSDIKTQIDTMRALARDSQISTALSYYATDATTTNTSGQIIWATGKTDKNKDTADIINQLFERWNINRYARDHILELATIGNLYIPTTEFYRNKSPARRKGVALDHNTVEDDLYDIVPSTKIPPEDIIHVWRRGVPYGFVHQPSDGKEFRQDVYPESSIIHFSLGGLLGDYTIQGKNSDGSEEDYDIQFATPLLAQATQPTQTLSLLEDAMVLSSLNRTIKFIGVECGTEEEEIRDSLQQVKDSIEQQLSLNTASGDVQSFVNPQSPNNLIYVPKIGGQDPISVTDLNMAEATDADNKLLQYYQDKKLSVLGVPKEAMNFSSNEGLGGAGSVLSQRSALYANGLLRIEMAYISGWRDAINKYFVARNMGGLVDTFVLHMNPIITTQSTIQFEKRDSALSQATSMVDLLQSLGVQDKNDYTTALTEILSEVLPKTGSEVHGWELNVESGGEEVAM